jgi:hypothetical protein
VLSLKRKIEEEIDDAKLEARAKKELSAVKREKKDVGKVIPTHQTTDYEKSLKKIATRGGLVCVSLTLPSCSTLQCIEGGSKNSRRTGSRRNTKKYR